MSNILNIEEKKEELDDSEEELYECIINPNGTDRRRGIRESPNKNDGIIQCIGSLETQYIPDPKIKEVEKSHGTGTVIHIDKNNYIYVLTAAHNIYGAEKECNNCQCKTLKKGCPVNNCNGATKKTKKLIKPTDIYFTRRGDGKKFKLGQSVETYQVEKYESPKDYTTLPDPRSGYDIAVVIFNCHDDEGIILYREKCKNIQLIEDKTFGGIKCAKFIFGYPGDRRKVEDDETYYFMYGHGTSKIDETNKFSITTNNNTMKEYIINEGIDTTVGESGSPIYSYNKDDRKKFLVYGVHSGGSSKKKQNYGTYFDEETMNWIRNVFTSNHVADLSNKIVQNKNNWFEYSFTPQINDLKFKVIVAIDLGSYGYGLGYFVVGSNKICIEDRSKNKTALLLGGDGTFKAFGEEALKMYMNQSESKSEYKSDDQNMLFQSFKSTGYIPDTIACVDGRSYSTSTVFVQTLKCMKQHIFEVFKDKKIKIDNIDDVQWILTVPAFWSDRSKYKMEVWAKKAGLIANKKVLNQLLISYEPDCSSISIQNEIKQSTQLNNLTSGDKCLLLDLGDATADISCYQIIDGFNAKEICQPFGVAWGSNTINQKFITLLSNLFPEEWVTEFKSKRPTDYAMLMQNFACSKETFYANTDKQSHSIKLPSEFIKFLDNKLKEYITKQSQYLQHQKNENTYAVDNICDFIAFLDHKWKLNDDKLELDYSIWTKLFDEVIDPIISHCKRLISELKLKPIQNKQCCYICVVGGFSSNKYSQLRILNELGAKTEFGLILFVPKRPFVSVVDGALRLGLTPNYIKARLARKTYGIKVNAPVSKFNINEINELDQTLVKKNIYFHKRANQQYLHMIFYAFVRKGDEIAIDDKPKTTKFYGSKKNIVGIEMYASDDTNPIFVSGKPIAKKDVLLPKDWDIYKTFPVSFFFGGTKIRVFADIDGIEEHEKEIQLDYQF